MAMEGNNVYLPHEVIVNILKRLPVKFLIQLQCVCKGWKNLLKDPLFIADHLHHSSHRPSLLLRLKGDKKELHYCSFDCDFRLRDVHTAPLIASVRTLKIVQFKVIGSSNGLLCINSPHALLLWNPAIGEVREVPTTTKLTFDSPIGFGFNMVANDYKIVNIYENRNRHGDVDGVEVYSLSTGLWKDVEFGTLKGLHINYKTTFTSNGAIFWIAINKEHKRLVIVSFDMVMEVFTLIPMPALHPRSTFIPTIYDERLALLAFYKIGTFESCFIHLWVIEKNTSASGRRWSCIKKYCGRPYLYPYSLIPQCIWRNEIVFKVNVKAAEYDEAAKDEGRRTLCFLNTTTNEFNKFVVDDPGFMVQIINYVESLVPVG